MCDVSDLAGIMVDSGYCDSMLVNVFTLACIHLQERRKSVTISW